MNNILTFESNNFNDLFIKTCYSLLTIGSWTRPRGFKCKELIGCRLVLNNPLDCLITIKDRKLNYAYSIIEKFRYLSGKSNEEIILSYNSKMKDFLNTSGTFDGAYGPRISNGDQFNHAFELLKNDEDSRQAVITINDFRDRRTSLDKPCTLSLQFLIRSNKLILITTMRSNDIMWGLCLDAPAFCFLQEVMCSWLRKYYPTLGLGEYIHQAGSMHYYDNFEEQIVNMVKPERQMGEYYKLLNFNELNNVKNPTWDISKEDTNEALELFWKNESIIRSSLLYEETRFKCINQYLDILLNYWKKKSEKNKA